MYNYLFYDVLSEKENQIGESMESFPYETIEDKHHLDRELNSRRMTKAEKRKIRKNFNKVKNGVKSLNLKEIEPISEVQDDVFESFIDQDMNVVLHGYPGTGKTFVALYLGMNEVFDENNNIKKVIIVRSAVQTRDKGFMPGNDKEKDSHFETIYHKPISKMFGRDDAYAILKHKGLLEFYSTSFLRGQDFEDSIIIVDEYQSMNFHELDTVITRCGDGSRIIFSGDTQQDDLIKSKYDVSGIERFNAILKNMDSFDFHEFGVDDIVRSGLVREYIIRKIECSSTTPLQYNPPTKK